MTLSEFSMERPRYESQFGLEMPLVRSVQEDATGLEKMAGEIAQKYFPHARDKSFTYVGHANRQMERGDDPELAKRLSGSSLVFRGIDAVNCLTQIEIDKELSEWLRQHPDYATLLRAPIDPRNPGFVMHPGFSLSGIALSTTYGHASNQDMPEEKAFFRELLYRCLIIAYLDAKHQRPADHPWIARDIPKIVKRMDKVFNKLNTIHDELKV